MVKKPRGRSAGQISLPVKDWLLAEYLQEKLGYRYISRVFEYALHAYARQHHVRLRIKVGKVKKK